MKKKFILSLFLFNFIYLQAQIDSDSTQNDTIYKVELVLIKNKSLYKVLNEIITPENKEANYWYIEEVKDGIMLICQTNYIEMVFGSLYFEDKKNAFFTVINNQKVFIFPKDDSDFKRTGLMVTFTIYEPFMVVFEHYRAWYIAKSGDIYYLFDKQ
jgi:hypothetical protein